jgi:hypothetical protein
MAGLFDNMDERIGGIFGRINDKLFNDSDSSGGGGGDAPSTFRSPFSTSRTLGVEPGYNLADKFKSLVPDTRSIRQRREDEIDKARADLNRSNSDVEGEIEFGNTGSQKPTLGKNPGENTFLGAVGEYFKTAKTNWKDNGGFEALMSKPEFGIGLSLLQQASEGKSIGEAGLKAALDGGLISRQYAKQIAARAKVLGPATGAQIEQVKARLLASGYGSSPSWYKQIVTAINGGSATAEQEMAFAEIAQKANKLAKDAAESGRGQGVEFSVYQDQAILNWVKENGLDKGGLNPFNKGSIKGKDKLSEDISKLPKKELGGPVTKGTSYLVGEVGPEVFIPKETGKIVSYDDSKIINLLLESNPQLKSVSPARAEKILRNRFPDYFE